MNIHELAMHGASGHKIVVKVKRRYVIEIPTRIHFGEIALAVRCWPHSYFFRGDIVLGIKQIFRYILSILYVFIR